MPEIIHGCRTTFHAYPDILLFLHNKKQYVPNSKVKVGLYVYGTSNESWRTVISAGLEADPARASMSAQSTKFQTDIWKMRPQDRCCMALAKPAKASQGRFQEEKSVT